MHRHFGLTPRTPAPPDMALEQPSWLAAELRGSARRQRARQGARALFWWTIALALSLSTLVALQRGMLDWLVGP